MDVDTLLLEYKMTSDNLFEMAESIISKASYYTIRLADGIPSLVYRVKEGLFKEQWFVLRAEFPYTAVAATVSGNDVEKGQFISVYPFSWFVFVPDLYDSNYTRHFHESSEGFDFVEVVPMQAPEDDGGFFKHKLEPDIVGTKDEKRIYVQVFEDGEDTFICRKYAEWVKLSKREYYHMVFDSPIVYGYIKGVDKTHKNLFQFDTRKNVL